MVCITCHWTGWRTLTCCLTSLCPSYSVLIRFLRWPWSSPTPQIPGTSAPPLHWAPAGWPGTDGCWWQTESNRLASPAETHFAVGYLLISPFCFVNIIVFASPCWCSVCRSCRWDCKTAPCFLGCTSEEAFSLLCWTLCATWVTWKRRSWFQWDRNNKENINHVFLFQQNKG